MGKCLELLLLSACFFDPPVLCTPYPDSLFQHRDSTIEQASGFLNHNHILIDLRIWLKEKGKLVFKSFISLFSGERVVFHVLNTVFCWLKIRNKFLSFSRSIVYVLKVWQNLFPGIIIILWKAMYTCPPQETCDKVLSHGFNPHELGKTFKLNKSSHVWQKQASIHYG